MRSQVVLTPGVDTNEVQPKYILKLVEGNSTEIHCCLLDSNIEEYELEALKGATWSLRTKDREG